MLSKAKSAQNNNFYTTINNHGLSFVTIERFLKYPALLVVSAVTKEDISHRNISEWPQSVNVRAGDLVSVETLHHPAWPPIISDLQ